MSSDLPFSRAELREVMAEVKAKDRTVKHREACVRNSGCNHGQLWEFWFRGFYWYGRASNAYDARAQGFSAWLRGQK